MMYKKFVINVVVTNHITKVNMFETSSRYIFDTLIMLFS